MSEHPGVPPGVTLRAPGDHKTLRKMTFDNALTAASNLPEVSNNLYTLKLNDVHYADPDRISKSQHKQAILRGESLGRRLRGTWNLIDNASGTPISSHKSTIAEVPYITDNGTVVLNGVDYSVAHQTRLKPGVFARIKSSGEAEAHINLLPGTGQAHRMILEPGKGTFRLHFDSTSVPLISVLKAMEVPDNKIRNALGDLYGANTKIDNNHNVSKLIAKIVKRPDPKKTPSQQLTEALGMMRLDPEVSQRSLGAPFDSVSPDFYMAAAKRVLDVNKGGEQDDRDALYNQLVMGPEDLISERLRNSRGDLHKLLFKATLKKGVDHIPSGFLTPRVQSAIVGSGLGNPLEEVNPLELLDQSTRITRMGQGGIPSSDSIPMECYDEESEVFTKNGWIPWANVDVDTEFAVLIDGRLGFSLPLSLIKQRYQGPMYGLKTRTLDYLVTPNHRLWCRKYRGKGQLAPWGFQLADSCHRTPREFTIGHDPYQGRFEKKRKFTLPKVDGARKIYSFNFDDWAELVGWYASEGSIDSWALRNASKYKITISQNRSANPEKVNRIGALLTRMGIAWSYSGHNFSFVSKQIGQYLHKQVGKGALDKHLPGDVAEWPSSARHRLLESMVLGDGSQPDTAGWLFSSNSFMLVNDCMFLAISLGYAVRESKPDLRKYEESIHPKTGRRIPAKKNPSFRCQLLKSKVQSAVAAERYNQCYYTKDYNGLVYCAQVPGELLLVRRGRSPGIWSGNSRAVHPTQYGFIDPIRTPENLNAGVDMRLASGAMKGSDGRLYSKFIDSRTGQTLYRSPQDLADKTVAFHGDMDDPKNAIVRVIKNNKLDYAHRGHVDYHIADNDSTFNQLSNLILSKSGTANQRIAMGSRMLTQAMPLSNPEAPLVRPGPSVGGSPYGVDSFSKLMGEHVGAVRAKKSGIVQSIKDGIIKIQHDDGTTDEHELFQWHPLNRKSFIHQEATVKPGQRFNSGSLLARSNNTDAEGHVAPGTNLRSAYVVRDGNNFEDAASISESAARRLASDHMYQHGVEWDENHIKGKSGFMGAYPTKFPKSQLDMMDDDGVVKPGTIVQTGQPLVIAARKRDPKYGKVLKGHEQTVEDASQTWDRSTEGVVTDVVKTKNGVSIAVRSKVPVEVSDKISGLFGDKSIISEVIPDHLMPHDKDGRPFEALFNPLGVITRGNSSQVVEAILGKIAEKRGTPYTISDWSKKRHWMKFIIDEAKKYGVDTKDTITDPRTGKDIPKVLTGSRYVLRLHHIGEDKIQARGTGGGYDQDDQPSGGKAGGAKRLSLAELYAVLSHGSYGVIKDKALRSTRQSDWWSRYMAGMDVPDPKVPMAYTKFLASLQASGINPIRKDNRTNLMAMTDKGVDELADDREIKSPDTVDWEKNLKPIPGGLFDEGLTGAHNGHCFHPETRILTDQGWISIGRIVNEKLLVNVLSYNFETKSLEYQPVEQYWKKTTDEPLRRIKFGGGGLSGIYSSKAVFNSLYCTGNHSIYREDGTKVEADDLTDYVMMPTCRLGKSQMEALYGTMLGDASIVMGRDGNACLSIQHGLDQESYLRHKMGLFADFTAQSGVGLTGEKAYSTTTFTAEFGELRTSWYDSLGKKLPDNFEEVASDLTLALWFFDDGWTSINSNDRRVGAFCTQGFRESDFIRLQNWLENKYGIKTGKSKASSGWEITFGYKAFDKLKAVLRHYCPPGMEYKLGYELPAKWSIPFQFSSEKVIIKRPLRFVDRTGTSKLSKAQHVYDIGVQGNHNYFANGVLVSNSWAKITLPHPVPNPVMAEPIKKVLGITERELEGIISGITPYKNFGTGSEAIHKALSAIDLPNAIAEARSDIQKRRGSGRDAAVKRLKFLKSTQAADIHPKDWMLSKVPVIPPIFRPVDVMSDTGRPLVADANYLYRDLLFAKQSFEGLNGRVGDLSNERLSMYNAVKAVMGLGDPINPKNAAIGIKGHLKKILGSSPKYSMVQRKLLSAPVNMVSRSVISPDPDLGLDEVGIPEDSAWGAYEPIVTRQLSRRGMAPFKALEAVQNRTDTAKAELLKAMSMHPVIMSRAPVHHKFGVMAFWPKLAKGNSIRMNAFVTKGFGADYDGDQVNIQVPVLEEAVKDAIGKMMPSKNLIHPRNFSTHYKPINEFAGGLYEASTAKSDGKQERLFHTLADSIAAFKRNDIRLDTPVAIGQ